MKQVMYMMGVLLGSLALVGCATPRDASGTTVRGAEGAPELEGLARDIAKVLPSSEAAAAIVVVDEHGPVYVFAGNPEVHRGTGFEFASVTKVMTATLIAMLANEGLIDLDTAVTAYIEADELNEGWDSVTARQLLTHTAGVPTFPPNLNPVLLWLRGRASDPFAGYTSDRLLAGIRRSRPRAQRPWEYSNYGYAVLGYLAGRQTSVSYARLLQERVLVPAAMSHSAVRMSENEQVQELVHDMENRTMAISLVHQKLYQSQDLSRLDLGDYLRELSQLILQSFNAPSRNVTLTFALEQAFVLLDTAIPCGLIVNELLSNSIKHGYPDGGPGTIEIQLHRNSDARLVVRVADNGIGVSSDFDVPQQESLGLQTVLRIAEDQMNGEIRCAGNDGMEWEITFPDTLYDERV